MKSPTAFRTISEVADDLDLPQHVLRYWETQFRQIKPLTRGGGRRYYRPEDVDLLRGIRHLLYDEGFKIKGVQRLLKEKGTGFVIAVGQSGSVETVATPEAADEPAPVADGAPESDAAEDDSAAMSGPEATGAHASGPLAGTVALSPENRMRLEAALADLVEAYELLERGT
jgi:DNA-binding transcriptional MerR regulator